MIGVADKLQNTALQID